MKRRAGSLGLIFLSVVPEFAEMRQRGAVICHKAACVPVLQPQPRAIVATGTAHRPEIGTNRLQIATRTRRNFLSFGQTDVLAFFA